MDIIDKAIETCDEECKWRVVDGQQELNWTSVRLFLHLHLYISMHMHMSMWFLCRYAAAC